jgi:hypothetical protein
MQNNANFENSSEEESDASVKDLIKGPLSKKFYLAMLSMEQ